MKKYDKKYDFSERALKAGEDVLRSDEPDYFDYGQKPGWHFHLVNRVAYAVLEVLYEELAEVFSETLAEDE